MPSRKWEQHEACLLRIRHNMFGGVLVPSQGGFDACHSERPKGVNSSDLIRFVLVYPFLFILA
jgi:hypothetical protein